MLVLKKPAPTRETVTTIRTDGSRAFLFPAESRGRFTTARKLSAIGLISLYLLLPWVKIGGYPAVFLDAVNRRFHLFGITLAAEDTWLLFFLITGLGFALFFATALLGRVWCGWACPQTVFLDHVYRRIERWIEGDSIRRRALAAAPWTASKIWKCVTKHTAYILVSAIITHLLLAYFVSLPQVWQMVTAAPGKHWGAFAFSVFATGLLYFNFAWFREQLCIVMCPYGRFQSALIDDHSLVVGYDAKRGEPRGKVGIVDAGACIDCNKCVQVCPTGIDIRHGLQMECIGCTACIDACDNVMTRLGRPQGLIRYDSQKGFQGQKTRWLRGRTFLYFALLVMGASVSILAVSTVKPMVVSVTRIPGAPYVVDDASVRNQFLVRIINKRDESADFMVALRDCPANASQAGLERHVSVPGMGEVVQPLIVMVPRRNYTGPFSFQLQVTQVGGRQTIDRGLEFVGPEARLLKESSK